MMNNFSWSLHDIENMIYWEREIYVKLIAEFKQKKEQQMMEQMYRQNYNSL